MIAVSGGVQVEGLGRCFAHTVDHNRIYLSAPTLRSTFCYDIHHGSLSEMWGTYKSSIPVVVAQETESGRIQFKVANTSDGRLYDLERQGWSNDLAKSCFPTVLTTLTEIVLNSKKEEGDLEKAMVEYVKIKVKRYKSDGSWHFTHDGVDWDFERCLNEIMLMIDKKLGITYTFNDDVVLDYYLDHAHDVFTE